MINSKKAVRTHVFAFPWKVSRTCFVQRSKSSTGYSLWTSWDRQRYQLLSSNIVIQICRRHLLSVFPVRPIANLFNPFWMRTRPLRPPSSSHSFTTGSWLLLARIISAARETLYLEVLRLKWMATRAIRLIACYFELPCWFRLGRKFLSLSLSFLFIPFPSFSCPPPIEKRQTSHPVLPPYVVPVLCVSEAEETRRADPWSGVVKIRRAAPRRPYTAGSACKKEEEKERKRSGR